MTPSPALLLLGAALIGWGNLWVYGMYSPPALRLVAAGTVTIAVGSYAGVRRLARPDLAIAVAVPALLVWQAIGVARVVTYYGSGRAQFYARLLSVALPTLGMAVVAGSLAVREWAWRLLLVTFAVSVVAVVAASPHPGIDVWFLIQHASNCVLHGCNPYTMTTPDSPGVKESFNYLPMTAVLLAPFRALVGDTRYGDGAAVLAAAVLVRRMARGEGRRIAALMLCVPGLLFAVEQAWNESLLVLLLVVTVWSRRPVVSGVVLGLALATKQHVWLLVPVAAFTLGARATAAAVGSGALLNLPWFVADPAAMWRGTVTFLAHLPARIDATTVWLHEPVAWRLPVVTVALAIAYVLAWLTCHGSRDRFLLGSALVLAAFDLTNKQTFFNQWLLVTWLVVAAVALALGPGPRGQRAVSIVAREV